MTPLDELKLKNAGLTVSRMVQSYKQAMDPTEHINILSDQTLIEPEHIVDILRENGCPVGKWHKRWTPDDRKKAVEQLKKIQKVANKAQEQEKKSQEPEEDNKEVKMKLYKAAVKSKIANLNTNTKMKILMKR